MNAPTLCRNQIIIMTATTTNITIIVITVIIIVSSHHIARVHFISYRCCLHDTTCCTALALEQLCVLGEHTDWAAGYRNQNRAIPPGFTLVATTREGLHARVKARTDGRLVFSAAPSTCGAAGAPAAAGGAASDGAAVRTLDVAMTEEVTMHSTCTPSTQFEGCKLLGIGSLLLQHCCFKGNFS